MELAVKKNTVEKTNRKKYYLIYSGIFLFCASLMVLYLYLHGKSNINSTSDGMNQHFRALIYYSRYLKEIFKTLFTEHRLVLPLWDMSIGEGADIITTLHSDAVGDPLTFLSVLIPGKYLPLYYVFNVLIRMYLAGIFFSKFCFYTGRENETGVLAGALTYVFGFWALHAFTIHIYFTTPLMYLPLLLLGIEKILKERRPQTFILAVFLSSISWLYFFYMEALATAIYGIFRVFFLYKKEIGKAVIELIRILLFAILGILMAGVVLLPMVHAYMGDSRMGIATYVPALYPRFFYERLFTVFVSNDSGYDLFLGFTSATLLGVVVLLRNARRYPLVLILNLICLLSVLVPFLGKAWNGFSYVSQRWSFVIAMPIAYDLVLAWDEFRDHKKLLLFSLPLLTAMAFFSAWARNERVIVPMLICYVFCLIAIADERYLKEKVRQVLLISLITFNVLYIFEYNLSERGGDVLSDLMSIEEVKVFTESSEAYLMKGYTEDEEGFFRYSGNYLTNNASILYDVHSTNFYWSITNPYDQIFRMDLGLRDRLSWQLIGYDDRSGLETLANVRYYILRKGYYGVVPYGFELVNSSDSYEIYENRYALPFGYTYKESISQEEFDGLDPLQKEEAMLQKVVLSEGNSQGYRSHLTEKEYDVKAEEGIVLDGKTITVKEKDAKIRLNFDGESGQETYLLIEGLRFEDTEHVIEDDHTSSTVHVESDNGTSLSFNFMPSEFRYYFGKTDYVCYLGNDEIRDASLSFSLVGTYTYDGITVVNGSVEDYEKEVDALKEAYLENVSFDANTVKGEIDLKEDRYLLLSVPYSKGWKAYVDGSLSELLVGNEHYMALNLNAGHHTIELKYRTPGLNAGIVCSILGIVCFCIVTFYRREKKR